MSSTGYEVTFSETTYAMFYETDMYVIDKRWKKILEASTICIP